MAIVFKDMQRDPEKGSDLAYPTTALDNGAKPKPYYPYGLNVCLCDEELTKLGIDPSTMQVGGVVHLHSLAKVTSVSINDDEGGKSVRVELCLEQIALESEDDENKEADRAKPATRRLKYGR